VATHDEATSTPVAESGMSLNAADEDTGRPLEPVPGTPSTRLEEIREAAGPVSAASGIDPGLVLVRADMPAIGAIAIAVLHRGARIQVLRQGSDSLIPTLVHRGALVQEHVLREAAEEQECDNRAPEGC